MLLVALGLACGSSEGRIPNPSESAYQLHTYAYHFTPIMAGEIQPVVQEGGAKWYTYGAIGAVHLASAYPAYEHLTSVWGQPVGKFHLKHETADYLAFSDEVSHMFISYKLMQGISSAYRQVGISASSSRLAGAVEAALVMTAVEFPVDAYNPDQGLGITDLVADYMGVGLAYWKSVDPRLANFDLKVSMKSFSSDKSKGLGYDCDDYDNYVYWLTYRHRFAVVGIGYSTSREVALEPNPELHLGIGTTIPDLVSVFSSKLAKTLQPLELYFINFNVKAF
jgi:hypothetical protein